MTEVKKTYFDLVNPAHNIFSENRIEQGNNKMYIRQDNCIRTLIGAHGPMTIDLCKILDSQ